MKKYGTILASVIFTLLIILIPGQKIEASYYSFDIDTMYSFESLPDATVEQLLDTIAFLKSIENDYYVYFTFIDSSYYYNITIIDKNNSSIKESFINYSSKTISSNISFVDSANGFTKEFRNYNYSTSIESVKTDFNNKNFRTIYSVSSSSTNNLYLIYSNVEFTIKTLGSSNEILSDGNSLKSGDVFPSWYDWYLENQAVQYDYNVKINPNDYNFFYLKFNSLGDSSFYFKHNLTSGQDLFYMIYKNLDLIYTPIVYNNTDLYIEDYFVNSNDSDVFTVIVPFYKYDFINEDIFDFYFTIPGLIEYGTDKYKYTVEDGQIKEEELDRSDITGLLRPGENVIEEIISSSTSHNTLSNDSLNEFMWPYSLFARNGNNIKNISLIGSYASTSSFNVNDFKTNLIINYGDENYKININNCIINDTCYLTKYEQNLIKNILFDRNVENSNYYLDFSIIPQKNMTLSDSDQFNFGISISFNSSVELTINSMLLAINDLSNSYYNVHFKLYDSKGQIHTIYKTSLDNEYIGVNQFQLDSRTSDIYRVDLMFVYNHTSSNIFMSDNYSLKFSEFNIFANTEMIHIYTENTEATYQTCSWYDLFCHGQNLFTWLIYDAPFTSDFWTIFLYITNIFNNLWTLITYIFMPFDIIPPIFGIPISTIMPVICFVLVLIWRMWFGGDK